MAKQILVVLERGDRVEGFIPYLREIAKPGIRVVFVVPYPVDLGEWWRDHWVTTESVREAMLEGRKITERYSWEIQGRLAEQRVLAAKEAFCTMSIEVAAVIYTGCVREVVKECMLGGDIPLIMERAVSGNPIAKFLRQTILGFGLGKRIRSSAVLLLDGGQEI